MKMEKVIALRQARYLRAFELRQEGLSYRAIGKHPDIGDVEATAARDLVLRGENLLLAAYQVKPSPAFIQEQKDVILLANKNETKKYIQDPLVSSVKILGLSARANWCLRKAGIPLLGDLVAKTEAELLGMGIFGRKSLTEVKDELHRIGYKLREP